jgi:uncharacterized membrane protein
MKQKKMTLIKYSILSLLGIIAIWQIACGKQDFGVGLLAGLIFAGLALGIKNRQISKSVEKGMNPYDERVWTIAGRASYLALRIFAITCALVVLGGSIWGPAIQVNPYNLLGICLSVLMLLYIICYYYYNHKM